MWKLSPDVCSLVNLRPTPTINSSVTLNSSFSVPQCPTSDVRIPYRITERIALVNISKHQKRAWCTEDKH